MPAELRIVYLPCAVRHAAAAHPLLPLCIWATECWNHSLSSTVRCARHRSGRPTTRHGMAVRCIVAADARVRASRQMRSSSSVPTFRLTGKTLHARQCHHLRNICRKSSPGVWKCRPCGNMPAVLPCHTSYDSLSLDRAGVCSCQWHTLHRACRLQSFKACRVARRCVHSACARAQHDAVHKCVSSSSADPAAASDQRGYRLQRRDVLLAGAIAAVASASDPRAAAVRTRLRTWMERI